MSMLEKLVYEHFHIINFNLPKDKPFLDVDGLEADSLDLVELSIIIENHYDILIDNSDMDRLTSLDGIEAYLKEKNIDINYKSNSL